MRWALSLLTSSLFLSLSLSLTLILFISSSTTFSSSIIHQLIYSKFFDFSELFPGEDQNNPLAIMAGFEGLGAGIVMLLFFGRITCTGLVSGSLLPVCALTSIKDSILGSQDDACPVDEIASLYTSGVIEGNEGSLQRALYIVNENTEDYVAMLFYATWCPFSRTFTPTYSVLASLFPSIPHFAIEESTVRPSVLSKYGVHGFPSIFLLNSTLRVRYHGSRTIDSLVTFYKDIADIEPASANAISLAEIGCSLGDQKRHSVDTEICPFSWARSPENWFGQDTYLALATTFLLLRVLYILFPSLHRSTQLAWRRYVLNTRLRNLWEHPSVYLNRAIQVFSYLKEPCKRSNLQEGAMNAKAWLPSL